MPALNESAERFRNGEMPPLHVTRGITGLEVTLLWPNGETSILGLSTGVDCNILGRALVAWARCWCEERARGLPDAKALPPW